MENGEMILPILDFIATSSGNNPFKGSPANALIGENGLLTNPSGAWDLFKNGRTNEVNQAIAEQNLAFQRENLDYNRALNEEIFNRADTAYQRQVADMRSAGLNPLMAQGGAETGGSATPTEALHNDFQYQDQGMASALQSIGDILNTVQNYQIGFDFAREQKAKADSATAQSTVDKQTALYKVWQSQLDFKTKKLLANDLAREMDYNEFFGLNSGMNDTERMWQIMTNEGKRVGFSPYIEYGSRSSDPNKWGIESDYGSENFKYTEDNYKNLASNMMANQFVNWGLQGLQAVGDLGDIFMTFKNLKKKPNWKK